MKRLVAVIALSLGSLWAAGGCDPCWTTCGPCGDFDLGAHYLYWKPAVCEYEVALRGMNEANRVQVIGIKPDYDSGVRAWLGYYKDCSFARVSYLWLETNDRFTIEQRPGTALVVPGAGFFQVSRVRPSLRISYQNVDVRLGQYLHRGRACTFGVFGNFRWVDVERRFREEVVGGPQPVRFEQKSEFDGGGLGVGMTGDFCIWNGFSGFGEFGAMAVIGERRAPRYRASTLNFENQSIFQEVRTRAVTCVIPELEFRVGVSYAWDCLCTTVVFDVGYELDYYWSALRFADLPNVILDSIANGKTRCRDIGFAGPYFGVHAMF